MPFYTVLPTDETRFAAYHKPSERTYFFKTARDLSTWACGRDSRKILLFVRATQLETLQQSLEGETK